MILKTTLQNGQNITSVFPDTELERTLADLTDDHGVDIISIINPETGENFIH